MKVAAKAELHCVIACSQQCHVGLHSSKGHFISLLTNCLTGGMLHNMGFLRTLLLAPIMFHFGHLSPWQRLSIVRVLLTHCEAMGAGQPVVKIKMNDKQALELETKTTTTL
jgi:hypothetical protein